jgi:hypothetical protein
MNKTKWIKEWEQKAYIRVKKSRHYDNDNRIDNEVIKYVGSRFKNEIGNTFKVYKDFIKNNYYRGRIKKSADLRQSDFDNILELFYSMENRFNKVILEYDKIINELYDKMYSLYRESEVSNENKYIGEFFKGDKTSNKSLYLKSQELAISANKNKKYIVRWLKYVDDDFIKNLENDKVLLKIQREKSN